jgi:hypothetical protein
MDQAALVVIGLAVLVIVLVLLLERGGPQEGSLPKEGREREGRRDTT